MQSNINPKEAGDVSSMSTSDIVSDQAEEEQAKLDKASEELNLTKLLEKTGTTQNADKSNQHMVRTLGQILGNTGSDNTGPGKLNLPEGYEYLKNMSPEDAIVLINDRSSTQVRELVSSSVTRLKGSQQDYKDLHEKNLERLKMFIEKAGSSSSSLIVKILFFLLMFVIAVVAIVAAVIAPSPVLIIGAISAVMGLINSGLAIVSEVTGEDVTFSGVMRRMAEGIEESLVDAGMAVEKAEAAGKMLAGATGIMTGLFLGDPGVISIFFEGMGQSMGMSENASKIFGVVMSFIVMLALMGATMNVGGAASSTGSAVSTVSNALGSSDDIAKFAGMSDDLVNISQAGLQATQAGYGLYQAKVQHDTEVIKAEVTEIQAFLQALRKDQELEEDMLKDLVSHMARMQELANESVQSVLRSSGSAFRSMV